MAIHEQFKSSKITISLHVFGWKRSVSLRRLLKSLLNAKYFNDCLVPLTIHIDGESTVKVNRLVRTFDWPFGPLEVLFSQSRVGLQQSITGAWIPNSPKEYSIFLEDDVEVSPLFYKYAAWCVSTFFSKTAGKETHENKKSVIGCSLYTPRINEIKLLDPQMPPLWSLGNNTNTPVALIQLPCSWGTVMSPTYWKRFLDYYQIRQQINLDDPEGFPKVPDARSNTWDQSWKRFMIEFMYANALTLVYPNFVNETSFTTNHYEEGVHTVPQGHEVSVPDTTRLQRDPGLVDERFTVPLFNIWDTHMVWKDLLDITKKGASSLPVFDLYLENSTIQVLKSRARNFKNAVYSKYPQIKVY